MTSPRMRAGTADRQAAVDGLTRHFTEGRLDPGEFDERVGTAYAATYLDELPELFADLPEAQPRRGTGSGARPDPDGVLPYAPVPPPGPWSGPPRPPIHRPPRLLAVLAVLALIFLIGVLTHGLFLFPLVWVAFFLIFSGRGGHRRRWADPPDRTNNRW
jgi:Domain of unknown function (DUF1707)